MKPEIIDNINKPSHYQGRYGMESIDAFKEFHDTRTAERLLSWKCLEVSTVIPEEKWS